LIVKLGLTILAMLVINIESVIKKAGGLCGRVGEQRCGHFADIGKKVELGRGVEKKIR
jgi:hypothetical protein